MRRKRFGEEQIISILKESAAGMKTEEVCRRHGICTNTFYRWKAKYADMEVSERADWSPTAVPQKTTFSPGARTSGRTMSAS